MLIDLKNLADDSKVMIFPASRKLYPNEVAEITDVLSQFLKSEPEVSYGFDLRYDRFILIFISSETSMNIAKNDALIVRIQQFEQKFNLTLIDKVKVFFKQGAYVQSKEVPDFKKMIKSGSVGRKTVVFNNFVHFKAEFDCCWEVPANESWIAHFFK